MTDRARAHFPLACLIADAYTCAPHVQAIRLLARAVRIARVRTLEHGIGGVAD